MTMSFHEGFSGTNAYEPVASSFYGLRLFLLDDLGGNQVVIPPDGGEVARGTSRGALRAVFRSTYVWGPGTNTAACIRPFGVANMPKHDPVFSDCCCGFWAFTKGKHGVYVNGPAVFGVIQGWGRIVVGPHGFRAEKARIVALCFDNEDEPAAKVAVRPGSLRSMISAAMYAAARALAASAPGKAAGLTSALLPRLANSACQPVATEEQRAWVRKAYPNVPVFPSVPAMLERFPVSDLTPLLPPPPAEEQCETEEGK